MRRIAAFLASLGPLFAGGDLLYACAVCLTGADGGVAAAYDWSVLFLMAMPYLVVTAIAGGLAYVYRRAANKRNQADYDPAPLGIAWNREEKER
jgi:hypothetical protein